jgi:hypothetical protein
MNRYNNGKIYSIRSHQTDDVYIGSTCMPLSKRFHGHKSSYKLQLVGKQPYECSAFKLTKFDDCYIELVEDYPCENKQQLLRREGELIRSMPCVNKLIAGRTQKEYQKEYNIKNQEYKKDMARQQYEKNKADILSTVTCEICNCKVTKQHLTRHNKTKKHLHNLQG